MKYYQLTAFPQVYKHTYWGNFEHDEKRYPSESILKARNEFVTSRDGLKGIATHLVPQYVEKKVDRSLGMLVYDHVEYYKWDKTYLIVNSPYCGLFNECELRKVMEQGGWEEIPGMYHADSVSFLLTVTRGQ